MHPWWGKKVKTREKLVIIMARKPRNMQNAPTQRDEKGSLNRQTTWTDKMQLWTPPGSTGSGWEEPDLHKTRGRKITKQAENVTCTLDVQTD